MRYFIALSVALSACAPNPNDNAICEVVCEQYAEAGCGFTGCVEFCVADRVQAREGECFSLVEQEYNCASEFVCDVASCRVISDQRRDCEAL